MTDPAEPPAPAPAPAPPPAPPPAPAPAPTYSPPQVYWLFTYTWPFGDKPITANEVSMQHPVDWLAAFTAAVRQGLYADPRAAYGRSPPQPPPVLLFFTQISWEHYRTMCRVLYGTEISPHDQARVQQPWVPR